MLNNTKIIAFQYKKQEPYPTFRANPQSYQHFNFRQNQEIVIKEQHNQYGHAQVYRIDKETIDNQMKFSSISNILDFSNSLSVSCIQQNNLIKKFFNIFQSNQNLYKHLFNSLLLKKIDNQYVEKIIKILVSSFSQFQNIYKLIEERIDKLTKNKFNQKIHDLNNQIAQLKMKNIQFFKQSNQLKRQKQILKKYYKQKIKKSQIYEDKIQINKVKEQIKKYTQQFNHNLISFTSSIYQKFHYFQNKMIEITDKMNNIQHQYHKISLNPPHNQKQCLKCVLLKQQCLNSRQKIKQISSNLIDLQTQVQQQKALYDQILDKNIKLQKQLYLTKARQSKNLSNNSEIQKFNNISDLSDLSISATVFFYKSQNDSSFH